MMKQYEAIEKGSVVTFFCEKLLTVRVGIVTTEMFDGWEVLLMNQKEDGLEPLLNQNFKVMFEHIDACSTIYKVVN